ncbi:ABC transporter substrate-binding protein [Halosimplex litoreum]|uniref:ABC transporter substrate-binding protein n=1 Tax=Halosimplex litoreum TaxID=1198301 RepID=A0A7T3G050_9EURY|nr:ABC transporter substrate-binding protein [Halosimplex litoreum]QPV63827.1 ABC transporter substrate-binding protein [Halosimplex litoreum]
MTDDTTSTDAPTRRDYLKYSAVLSGGLLAGCRGGESTATAPAADNETPGEPTATPSDTATQSATTTETATAGDTSYTVEMAPAGEVAFDAVPETWMTYFSTYGDMGIALGQHDGQEAAIFAQNWPTQFFEYLPGVDVSFADVEQIWADGAIGKETFYELDCDVHLMDPNFIQLLDDSWETDDFEEVATEIGPIIGNVIRLRQGDWHDYEYYSLYEAFEKVAAVFRERERYEALKSVHDEFVADVQARLPPESERPEVGLLSVNDEFETGTLSLYKVAAGNGKKQYQDLGMNDAFEDLDPQTAKDVDWEVLLDIDPDILVLQYAVSHVTAETFEEKKQVLRDSDLGSQLTAVRNDRLYPGGTAYQGPIINLFQTEMAAKQFYPEVFGEWNGYETFADESAWLFDHQRVADIVNGDI